MTKKTFWLLFILTIGLASCTSTAPAETTRPSTEQAQITLEPTALPTLTPVPTSYPNTLFVDAAQSRGPISPYVYGASYGPWVTVTVEMQPLAEESGVTYLRYPGGEWGDQNNLTELHIDRFVAYSRNLGAEPKINVRMPGGTPEQAAELVRYANVENDYDIRYWSIGNEPNLYTAYTMYEDFDTVRYNEVWRDFATAMRAVDEDIILIGPGISQYTGEADVDPRDSAGIDWMRAFLLANGDLVDIVGIHRYPFPTNMAGATQSIADLRENTKEWDGIIPRLRATIRETTGKDLPIAVSEINSDWTHATGGDSTTDSYYNAIWWGDVLGRLITQKVDIVAYFLLTSPTSGGGYGLLARYEPRPTYFTYQLYQQFGEELLYSSSDIPDVSIYAARREDGALTIMVINLGDDEKSVPLEINNFPIENPAEVWQLAPAHQAEHLGTEVLGDSVTLPGQSMTLYIIEK
ncbi:MAG: hypothetical protein DRI32_07855 [Chloroflexi bacterium]|nr:MAG: hypothetical protein DRI32_07855 [Chloroflexota bacterium]